MDTIADLVDPLLGCLLIAWPLILWRAGRMPSPPWMFWGASLLAIGLVYLLTYLDHRFRVWPSFGLDFSTHTAVAVCLITSLGILDRRSLLLLVPLLLFYVWLMLKLGYHSAGDVITAALITAPITLACHWLGRHKNGKSID